MLYVFYEFAEKQLVANIHARHGFKCALQYGKFAVSFVNHFNLIGSVCVRIAVFVFFFGVNFFFAQSFQPLNTIYSV